MSVFTITQEPLKIVVDNVSGHQKVKCLSSVVGLTPQTLVPFENSMNIDKRCHLEVIDTYHRYAKNLRAYHSLYKSLTADKELVSAVTTPPIAADFSAAPKTALSHEDYMDMLGIDREKFNGYTRFFSWLNSPAVVELPECSLEQLNGDVVIYCDEVQREQYMIRITEDGRFMCHSDVCTAPPAAPAVSCDSAPMPFDFVDTGPAGWIFCVHNYILYAGYKKTTSPRLHHSSFIAGGNVQAAGMFVIENGYLTKLYAHSGHYRPSEKNMYQLLNYLISRNVDVADVLVDAQRIIRISREKEPGTKEKKMTTAVMWPALTMLNFLKHKCLYERLAMDALLERRAVVINSENEHHNSPNGCIKAPGAASRGHVKNVQPMESTTDCLSLASEGSDDLTTTADFNMDPCAAAGEASLLLTPERHRDISTASCDSIMGDFPSLSGLNMGRGADMSPMRRK